MQPVAQPDVQAAQYPQYVVQTVQYAQPAQYAQTVQPAQYGQPAQYAQPVQYAQPAQYVQTVQYAQPVQYEAQPAQYSPHSAQYSPHSAQYAAQHVQYAAQPAQYSPHSAQYAAQPAETVQIVSGPVSQAHALPTKSLLVDSYNPEPDSSNIHVTTLDVTDNYPTQTSSIVNTTAIMEEEPPIPELPPLQAVSYTLNSSLNQSQEPIPIHSQSIEEPQQSLQPQHLSPLRNRVWSRLSLRKRSRSSAISPDSCHLPDCCLCRPFSSLQPLATFLYIGSLAGQSASAIATGRSTALSFHPHHAKTFKPSQCCSEAGSSAGRKSYA